MDYNEVYENVSDLIKLYSIRPKQPIGGPEYSVMATSKAEAIEMIYKYITVDVAKEAENVYEQEFISAIVSSFIDIVFTGECELNEENYVIEERGAGEILETEVS